MPKYSISDIHKRTVELDEGLLEMHKRQLEHERKLNSANGTAIAALVIGTISLVITLSVLAIS